VPEVKEAQLIGTATESKESKDRYVLSRGKDSPTDHPPGPPEQLCKLEKALVDDEGEREELEHPREEYDGLAPFAQVSRPQRCF